ncbi:MAG: nuclear transport factor 2 family protein [Flavisolibacter sp.]
MNKLFYLPLFFLLFSCRSSDRSGSNNEVRNEVKSTIDNYYSDIRKEGLIAALKYLDSSNQFFWIAPGHMNYVSYDSVVSAVRRNAASMKSLDNRYDSLLIVPLSASHAQFAMRTISVSVDAEGDTTHTAFIESGVMVKKNGGWKFLSGHTTILQ